MEIDQKAASLTVPVAIDSVKSIESFRMTRCTCYVIENSVPNPGWRLDLSGVDVNFFMLGLSGVITSPSGDGGNFDTPEKIDHLYDVIEANDLFFVDVNDIWLPNDLFSRSERQPERGDVFRVSCELFQLAYAISEEVQTHQEFLERLERSAIPWNLNYSKEESAALSEWNQQQINENRKAYHADTARQLPKKGGNTKPLPPMSR
jgi:hypothetical protein